MRDLPPQKNVNLREALPECHERRQGKHKSTNQSVFFWVKASLDDGVQRHHGGEWRVSPLDDPESNLRELKSAPAPMTEVDWRTPGCKTCQDVRWMSMETFQHRSPRNHITCTDSVH